MASSNQPRPVLAHDAPDRFNVDKSLLRQILKFLQSKKAPPTVALLPGSPEQLARCKNRQATVAGVLLASGRFDVEGFSMTPAGVRWNENPDGSPLISPYAYLSYLLRMGGDAVELLFGPATANDIQMHQWDPFPQTDLGILIARLRHYLREDTAVCPL